MSSQWPPKKNAPYTHYFTLYKNDGTVIANPGTITKKISIDGAAITDITASVSELNTTYGQLSIALSADEMNGDTIWFQIYDNTSGCVPETVVLNTSAYTLDEIGAAVAAILVDTGTTLDGLIKDIPTTAEFEARSLPAADYTVVGDLGTVQTGDNFAIVNGTSGHVATKVVLDAAKVILDKFAFTVTNQVDANMQSINDTALVGNGGVTPWGP
jgi:peroxiredoxin